MSDVLKNLRNIFLSPKPPILKVEFGIVSDNKLFCKMATLGNFIISEQMLSEVSAHKMNICIFVKNTENLLGSLNRSVQPLQKSTLPLRFLTTTITLLYISVELYRKNVYSNGKLSKILVSKSLGL